MKLYSNNQDYKLYNGNMLDMLDAINPDSIDSIITDPPYELNFMGKGWDNSGIAFQPETWGKCYEVLKPGGYLLAFGGSRTFHRIACAIEDAGFEIRDTIMWLYGSGFPKSMSLGKVVEGKQVLGSANVKDIKKLKGKKEIVGGGWNSNEVEQGKRKIEYEQVKTEVEYTTELGKQWQGWGTALKPSFEPIIVARKPFKGSLVDNVIEYGVGGINIDECRVGNETISIHNAPKGTFAGGEYGRGSDTSSYRDSTGRFPANTILTYDETDFDEVCGGFPNTKSTGGKRNDEKTTSIMNIPFANHKSGEHYVDSGSASRYFMNCKYTGKDEETWKQLLVNNVESNLEILKATKDNIVQMNVEDLLKELKDHYAKYVDNQLDLIETSIVQDIAKMLTWDFKIETSQVIQDFIINSKKCTQFLNLVQFVEKMDNIDTTQTTQNLLKLFGYVKVVITNYIQGNIEYDQKRYIYTPKASKKDRDEGLDELESKPMYQADNEHGNLGAFYVKKAGGEIGDVQLRKNTHPTVKPTELMQYLIRLVTPNNGTILDPFNGSGSTGKAVMYENKERNKNYKYFKTRRIKRKTNEYI